MAGEYGWTDEYLLGLTLGRLKLATRIIVERKTEEERARLLLAEEHARAIISVLPGLAQSAKAGRAIGRAARRLSFLPDDDPVEKERNIPLLDDLMRAFPRG